MVTMLLNWKTTAAGIAAGVLVALNQVSGQHMTWKAWASALAIAAVGVLAKDHDNTIVGR
jgi:hypothetical protein